MFIRYREEAKSIYKEARPNYHSVAYNTMDKLFSEAKDWWLEIIDPSAVGTTDPVPWGFNPTKKRRWMQIIDPSAVGTTDFVPWGFNPTKKRRWLQIIDPSAVGTTDIVKRGFNPAKKRKRRRSLSLPRCYQIINPSSQKIPYPRYVPYQRILKSWFYTKLVLIDRVE